MKNKELRCGQLVQGITSCPRSRSITKGMILDILTHRSKNQTDCIVKVLISSKIPVSKSIYVHLSGLTSYVKDYEVF